MYKGLEGSKFDAFLEDGLLNANWFRIDLSWYFHNASVFFQDLDEFLHFLEMTLPCVKYIQEMLRVCELRNAEIGI